MFDRLDSRVDVLTEALRTVRLGSVPSSRLRLRAPWAVRAGETSQRAGFHVVVSGTCWALAEGEPRVRLGPGDVVVFPHGAEHTLADDPATPAIEFEALARSARAGVPVSSRSTGAETEALCGACTFSADGSHPLLRGMPGVIHLDAERTRDTPPGAGRGAAGPGGHGRRAGVCPGHRPAGGPPVRPRPQGVAARPRPGRTGWVVQRA